MTKLSNPIPIFYDATSNPLDGGFVYIGAASSDPQLQPLTVYWDADYTIIASQPLHTIGGMIVNGATPSEVFFAEDDFSMRVLDSNQTQVFYSTSTYLPPDDLSKAGSFVNGKFIANTPVPSLAPSGDSSDRAQDISASAITAGPTGVVNVSGNGTYNVATQPVAFGTTFHLEGAQITGNKQVPGTVDAAALSVTAITDVMGDGSIGNRFVRGTQLIAYDTGFHTVNYEKATDIVTIRALDNSRYTSDGTATTPAVATSLRDIVGRETQTRIPGGTTRARVWGYSTYNLIEPGGDGLFRGIEVGLNNNGTAQPLFNTSTEKVLENLVADGGAKITAASAVRLAGPTSAGVYHGYLVFDNAASDMAFASYHVNTDGQYTLGGIDAATGSYYLRTRAVAPTTRNTGVLIWFDGTNLKVTLPNGTTKSIVLQ